VDFANTNWQNPPRDLKVTKSLVAKKHGMRLLLINVNSQFTGEILNKKSGIGVSTAEYGGSLLQSLQLESESNAVKRELNARLNEFDYAIVFVDPQISENELASISTEKHVLFVYGGVPEKFSRKPLLPGSPLVNQLFDYSQSDVVHNLEKDGNVYCRVPTPQGMNLILLNFTNGDGDKINKFWCDNISVNGTLKAEPELEDILREARKQMGSLDSTAWKEMGIEKNFASSNSKLKENVFTGSLACFDCHLEIARNWSNTAHSRALSSLVSKGEENRPECVKCHTVGFEQAGYRIGAEVKGRFSNVGCESCHGPGKSHISQKQANIMIEKSGADWIPHPTKKVCLHCHNGGHDTDFDFDRMLPLVKCRSSKELAGKT